LITTQRICLCRGRKNRDPTEFLAVSSIEVKKKRSPHDWEFKDLWEKEYKYLIGSFHWDPKLTLMVVGLDNGMIDCILVAEGEFQQFEDFGTMKVHENKVTGVVTDASKGLLYSISWDKQFVVTQISTQKQGARLTPSRHALTSIYYDEQNERVFIGSAVGEIFIYDTTQASTPHLITTLHAHTRTRLRRILVDRERNYLFTSGFEDGSITVFDLGPPGKETSSKEIVYMRGKQKLRTLSWSSNSKEVFSGDESGYITVWNILRGQPIYVHNAHDMNKAITSSEYLEDERLLITSSKDKTVKFWRIPEKWQEMDPEIDALRASLRRENERRYTQELDKRNSTRTVRSLTALGLSRQEEQDEEDSEELDPDLSGWNK